MSKPVCVLWINEAKAFEQALAHAGVADGYEVHGYALDQTVPDEVAARAEVLVCWRPAGMKRMPRLRYAQAMTAGVEAFLASPELAKDVTLCCARGTHRVSMPENILGAIFHLTCLLYTSPSPRDRQKSRMPSSA